MIRCGQCKWRESGGEYDGFCNCPKLYESEGRREDDHLVYSYSEGGGFWVGKNFGCVHGEKSNQRAKSARESK